MNAGIVVSSAILGLDVETCHVNGKDYVIKPPTIKKLAGAGYYLSGTGETVKDILFSLSSDKTAKALSWLIQGDESLTEELMEGTVEEIIDGIEKAYSLIKTENFIKLSVLTKSIEGLIAKQRR